LAEKLTATILSALAGWLASQIRIVKVCTCWTCCFKPWKSDMALSLIGDKLVSTFCWFISSIHTANSPSSIIPSLQFPLSATQFFSIRCNTFNR
jgi:hypothetical protein